MVVPVQARRTVAASGAELLGGDEPSGGFDLSAEVRGVQTALEHRLVDTAQFGEGEALAEEGGGDAGVLDLVAQPPQGVLDDQGVVEGELGQLVGDEPSDIDADGAGVGLLRAHQRPVDDRDGALGGGRCAVQPAEGVELLEVARGQPGRLLEGPGG